MDDLTPAEVELLAVERAAQIVEFLRGRGSFVAKYSTEEDRAVWQRAGRIARQSVSPRKMSAHSVEDTFVACWTEPTDLEREMYTLKAREVMDALGPLCEDGDDPGDD